MVKKSTYIRAFTDEQKKLIQSIAEEQKLKTAPAVLFYVLEEHAALKSEVARLKRFLEMKQKKIESLTNQ